MSKAVYAFVTTVHAWAHGALLINLKFRIFLTISTDCNAHQHISMTCKSVD